MKNKNKVDFKAIGLDIGLILAKQFLNTEYLHYGYWTEDLPVNMSNVLQSQENYANFLASHIPENTRSILDVGCGSGKFAEKLVNLGYEVDCVSPSPHLTKHARRILGERCQIFESGFEEVQTSKKYDLVLFSESFQYIPFEIAIKKALKFSKEPGQILICDFFRRDVEGKSPIGGGHDLKKFYGFLENTPIRIVKDIDITKETAPSLDIVDELLHNGLHPIWDIIIYALENNFPKFTSFLKWKYKKKIDKLNHKYFQRNTNANSFAHFKSYHLFFLQAKKKE